MPYVWTEMFDSAMARPSIPSFSEHCISPYALIYGITLLSAHAKNLAFQLAEPLKDSIGNMWKVVSATSTLWRHGDDTGTLENKRAPRRTFLFHLALACDVSGGYFEFLSSAEHKREKYYTL